jgi:8-oxo-dGTP diphosphatase
MPVSDQGKLNESYSLIPRTLIFLTCQDRILLLKGAPDKKLWANLYNGIGGHIEQGEGVLSAAHRELQEETGLSATDLRICGVIIIDTGQEIGIAIYVLCGECPSGKLESSTEGPLEWIPIHMLDQLPLVEDLTTLLPYILDMQHNDPPFSALYSYDQKGHLNISFG